jgi:hypothetical protein
MYALLEKRSKHVHVVDEASIVASAELQRVTETANEVTTRVHTQ